MKTSLAVLFIALIGIAAFLMGRGKSGGQIHRELPKINTRTASSQAGAPATASAQPKPKTRTGPDVFTAEKAGALTSEERVALMKKAALLADPEKQADILCGLISAMTQDELTDATQTLLDAQNRGNAWSQEVWNALWTQWGRVNAEACLALSKQQSGNKTLNGFKGLNTPNDYRCMMAGWLETHPAAAMAWARQAKDDFREATGAAFAITSSAKGDLKQMEAAILSISDDKLTSQACFQDYFDLATSTGDKPLPAVVYDSLDPKLREAAWPVVMERLIYADLQVAATWLQKHAGDPGCDYNSTLGLIESLAKEDPAGTAKWAVRLPVLNGGKMAAGNPDPAVVAVSQWRAIDPAAANAWVKTQSEGRLWDRRFSVPPAEDAAGE